MQLVSASELYEWIQSGKDIQLIDVREPFEHDLFNIGGDLIPFGQIQGAVERIQTDKPVVLYCEKGIRSMIAIQRLEQQFPSTQWYNLSGGMSAWRKEFSGND